MYSLSFIFKKIEGVWLEAPHEVEIAEFGTELEAKKEVEKPKVSVNSEDEGQESEVEKHADTDSH